MPALIPFIREGLSLNEQFIYIADDQTVDELADQLQQAGIDVKAESECGRLKLHTRKEWRQPGELDSNKKAEQVRQFIGQAAKDGFKGIRFAVEMTWTLGPDIAPHSLEHWEATLNSLFEPSFPARIICLYNRSRLDPEALLAALHTHPNAIVGDKIYLNPFFEAPLILEANGHANGRSGENGDGWVERRNGNGKTAHAKVEWMLSQLQRVRNKEEERIEAEVLRRTNRELCAGKVATLGFHILGPGGTRQDMETHAAPLRDPATGGLNQIAVTRNVTAQRAAEAAFQFLAAVVESSEDAIITKDLEGTITSWNNGAERLFGYTAEEAVGKPISILIPRELENEEPNILAQLRQGQRIDHYETVRQRKDGTRLDISLTVSPREGRKRSNDRRLQDCA
ncbi:MAG: putative Histidine kinase [Pedosphaera sp.]|nr:putative Histidine kinase [Pedosphaera sp.]